MDRGQIKKLANKLEKWFADELDGRRVAGSGSLATWKGDVELDNILLDSKFTFKSTMSVKLLDVEKIHREARATGRQGHLILTFMEDDKRLANNQHWVMVPSKYIDHEGFHVAPMQAKDSKAISKSAMTSLTRKANKQGLSPAIEILFERVAIGIPNKWTIIQLDNYREIANGL